MLISSMSRHQKRMAVLVVQQQAFTAAQDDTETSNQSARDERLSVDRLVMPIHRSRVNACECSAPSGFLAECQSWVAQHASASVKRSAPSARAICDKKASV